MSKRYFGWSALTVCLFLVAFGIRLPDLANAHSTPKPRPRALCETESSKKSSAQAPAGHVFAVELCDNIPTLHPPQASASSFIQENTEACSIALAQSGARAPPYLNC